MTQSFAIAGRPIGPDAPVYVIAELSANHRGSLDHAIELVRAMARAGADAVKLQTYTADTITIASDAPAFRLEEGSLWAGRTLHDLYVEASMPWAWQPRLLEVATEEGIHLFSSPFDLTAVAFLDSMGVPAFKIASFELVDLPLIRAAAATGRPLIMSTGMATLDEVDEAVATARAAGASGIALLKCTSAYPTPLEEMHLRAIPMLAARFDLPIGLSDHTLGITGAVAAVALGATIVEKHVTMSHDQETPDSAFSLDIPGFQAMVESIRATERALGEPRLAPTAGELGTRDLRRSLFAVEDIAAGEPFTAANVRSIRPAAGLHTRHYDTVLGRRAAHAIPRGTPLAWDLVDGGAPEGAADGGRADPRP